MPRALDLALYLGSGVLTAIGLTWIKLDLAGIGDITRLGFGWTAALGLAAAVAVYLGGMALWLAALGRNPLSVAYPIGIGLSLASATLAAILVLGEPVGLVR